MFRVTIATRAPGTAVILEGRLVGPWVDELSRFWEDIRSRPDAGPFLFHLDALTYVDDGGKALLRAMYATGAVLVATEVASRALVAEVTAPPQPT